MKIIAYTAKPKTLFKSINDAIENDELKTWEIKRNDKKEILYNHTPDQWSDRVLIKPTSHDEGLLFQTSWWSKNDEPDEATKGYIIGRFVEILMVHFREHFTKLEIK